MGDTILAALDDYDWKCAFEYAGVEPDRPGHGSPNVSAMYGCTVDASGFTRSDVAEVLAMSDGENDERDWIGLFRLHDGRIAFLSAGCDYTGWDCQAGGYAIVGVNVPDMIRLGLGEADRARLGFSLDDALAAARWIEAIDARGAK